MNQVLKLINFGKQSQGLKASALTIGGDVTAAGLSALALILLSRILGPVSFGQFSVGFSVSLILARIGDAGLAAASLKYIAKAKDQTEISQILSYIIRGKVLILIILTSVGLVFYPRLAVLLEFENPRLLAFAFIFTSVLVAYEQLQTTLQALHLFGKAVLVNIIQAAAKLIFAITLWMVHVKDGFIAFFLYVLAPAMPVVFYKLLLPNWLVYSSKIKSQTRQDVLAMVKHSSVAFISAGLIENMDVLFVQHYLDSYQTGLYSGVNRISLMFALIAFSLASVLNARVAGYTDQSHRKAYIKKAIAINILAAGGYICFLPVARLLLQLTIGSSYLPALQELLILTGGSFILLAAVPWIALFYSFKANWYFSLAGLLQIVVIVGGNLLLTPEMGMTGAALAKSLTRFSLWLFSVVLVGVMYVRENK